MTVPAPGQDNPQIAVMRDSLRRLGQLLPPSVDAADFTYVMGKALGALDALAADLEAATDQRQHDFEHIEELTSLLEAEKERRQRDFEHANYIAKCAEDRCEELAAALEAATRKRDEWKGDNIETISESAKRTMTHQADRIEALIADLEAVTRERDELAENAKVSARSFLAQIDLRRVAERELDEALSERQLLADRRATNDDIAEAAELALEAARDALREIGGVSENTPDWQFYGNHEARANAMSDTALRALDASASTENTP